MKKWEHKIAKAKTPLSAAQCDEIGEQGWEMVDILVHPTTGDYYYYFKREKIVDNG